MQIPLCFSSRQCTPTILAKEKSEIKQTVLVRPVAVIYDGRTYLGEVLVDILWFSDDQWAVKQVIACLKVLAKSLHGEQLAGELIEVLSTTQQVQRCNLVAAMKDAAFVNNWLCVESGQRTLPKTP